MIRAWVAALAMLLVAGEAGAQEFVRHDCRTTVQATGRLQFENDLHARWYKRFWTGACQDLSLCLPGSPNWNDVVDKLLTRGGPSQQPVLLPKACRLGQLIGMEWARDRRIKRIKTGDLKVFNTMLEASGDPLRGVDQVERKARTLITPP
ncbi:hypothetical protein ACN2C7_13910 [Caulobacter sp. ErkDOM-E]|uniref:hypothetical protein n=1 Tax=Caulobacter sp. ErkDOM-E TaxID=3402778 RepID=UPI003AF9639C